MGVISLSDLRLAWNVDDLFDDVTSLLVFCLLPESVETSDDVPNESSGKNEDEESD